MVRHLWLAVALVGVIGVALLLLIGPFLSRGHDRSEAYALSQLKTYVTAQVLHARAGQGYADDLGTLAKEKYVVDAFAAARGPKGTPFQGYLFAEVKTLGGKPVDWKTDFALSATPARYGGSKRRTFVVRTDGTIFSRDPGRSGLVEDFPGEPEKAGWRRED